MHARQKLPLLCDSMNPEPLKQFACWFREAEETEISSPNAMTLATATRQGKPSARIVLLKGVDERGFVFFTNYQSRKAQELQENPFAALVFCWPSLSRQVRVEGKVELVDPGESDLYFASRPRGHQIGAHASPQSQVAEDRAMLQKRFAEITLEFTDRNVPRPPHWGGYRLVPEVVEFWQEGESRLHDRLRYRRDTSGSWVIERLAP